LRPLGPLLSATESPPGTGISAARTRSDVRQKHHPTHPRHPAPAVRFPDRVTIGRNAGEKSTTS
jgi:hypothetical protein